jgi:hypothetical protein
MPKLGRNILWGIGWALALATLVSAYVIVLSIVRGSWHFGSDGVTSATIIRSCLFAALPVGIIVGIVRSRLRWREAVVGAVLIALSSGMFLYGGVHYAAKYEVDSILAGGIAGAVGALIGVLSWQHVQKYL